MHFGFLAIIKRGRQNSNTTKENEENNTHTHTHTRIVIHIYKHARKRKDEKELRIRRETSFFKIYVALDKSSLSLNMIRQFFSFLFFYLDK
jgi:hypothetical protein